MTRFQWCSVVLGAFLISIPNIGIAECPTEPVAFAKIMSPAFAADYEKCTVTTTVEFFAPGQTEGWVFGTIPKKAVDGRMAFRVLSPGDAEPTGGPFGVVIPHVFVAKNASDLVFDLKRGEAIVLIGHPVVGKKMAMPGGQDYVEIVFLADSIARVATAPDSTSTTLVVPSNVQNELPFAKVMNPAFAADYSSNEVRTRVLFVGNGPTEGYVFGAIPKKAVEGRAPFRVVAPGDAVPMIPPHVYIEKKSSDLLFELTKGDTIILIGHPVIGTLDAGGTSFTEVVFIASGIERAP